MGVVKEKFDSGDYNYQSQERRLDGSVLITLTKRGDPHVYRMLVKNFGQKETAMEVLSEEVVG
jgi:hypothetical protein